MTAPAPAKYPGSETLRGTGRRNSLPDIIGEWGRAGRQGADRGVPPEGRRGRLFRHSPYQVGGGGEELVEEGQAPPTLSQLSMQLKGRQVEPYYTGAVTYLDVK